MLIRMYQEGASFFFGMSWLFLFMDTVLIVCILPGLTDPFV